jgi:Tfp pilus assembly protein PilN
VRPIYLDFARPNPGPGRAKLAWLALSLLALGMALWQYRVTAADNDSLTSAIDDSGGFGQRPGIEKTTLDSKELSAEVERANAVLARLNAPWDDLFADIEAAAGPGVSLLGLQPEGDGKRLRLQGEARRFEDMLAYMTRLESGHALRHVLLVGHEMRDRAVVFTLSADWSLPR